MHGYFGSRLLIYLRGGCRAQSVRGHEFLLGLVHQTKASRSSTLFLILPRPLLSASSGWLRQCVFNAIVKRQHGISGARQGWISVWSVFLMQAEATGHQICRLCPIQRIQPGGNRQTRKAGDKEKRKEGTQPSGLLLPGVGARIGPL